MVLYHNDRKVTTAGYKDIFFSLQKFSVKLSFNRRIWGLWGWPSQHSALHKSYFTCCCEKSNLRKERSVLVHSSRVRFIMAGKSWQQGSLNQRCPLSFTYIQVNTHKHTRTCVTHTISILKGLYKSLILKPLVHPHVLNACSSYSCMILEVYGTYGGGAYVEEVQH